MSAFPSPDWAQYYEGAQEFEEDLGFEIVKQETKTVWVEKGNDYMRVDLCNWPTIHVEVWNGYDPRIEMRMILKESYIKDADGR